MPVDPLTPDLAPTFARTGILTHHDLGCRCWPHVSEQDALDAIAKVALDEYRDGKARLRDSGEPSVEPGLRVEAVAEAIYDAMRENDPEGRAVPWRPGGNSLMQDEARRRARAALDKAEAALSAETPTPETETKP